jgi:hypothetical protein
MPITMPITMPSYWYEVYGVRLRANRALPGLLSIAPAEGADWRVEICGAAPLPNGWQSQMWASVQAEDVALDDTDRIIFAMDGPENGPEEAPRSLWLRAGYAQNALDLVVELATRTVWVCWEHEGDEATMLACVSDLLGQIVMSFWQRIQGCYVLHAAALAVEGRDGPAAWVLIANAGAGKSSLTLALAAMGLHVLSEETAVLQREGAGYCVLRGMPRLRLWQSTLDAWGVPTAGLVRVPPLHAKYYLPLEIAPATPAPIGVYNAGRFAATAARLAGILWLEGRDPTLSAPRFSPLRASSRVTTLWQHRYHPFSTGPQMAAREFAAATHLTHHVPMQQLWIPDDLGQLEATAAALHAHFEESTAPVMP